MKPELKINTSAELLEILRAGPAVVPLRMSETTIDRFEMDAVRLGVSLVTIDVSGVGSDSDFLVAINASLQKLRLSELLSNTDNKNLTHIFLLSALHQVDSSLGLHILTVAQAFTGTSIRFCVLLPKDYAVAEPRALAKILDNSKKVLYLAPSDQVSRANISREEALIERFKKLERSLYRLDERAKSLESRGNRLLRSVSEIDIEGFRESLRPSAVLRDKIESRLEQVEKRSTAISARLSTYK